MNRKHTIFLILIVIIIFSLFAMNTASYCQDNSQNKTVKKYLRYGSFHIWDGFKESVNLKFFITNNEKVENKYIGFNIDIQLIHAQRKTLPDLVNRDFNIYKKAKKYQKLFQRKLNINGYYAVITGINYNGVAAKSSYSEICYIVIPEKIIKIKASGYKAFFMNGKDLWKEFYGSYRFDASNNYKTNFGSFKVISGMNDMSHIQYVYKDHDTYSITIEYINKEDNNIAENDNLFLKAINSMPNFHAKITKKQNLLISGKNVKYSEITATEKRPDFIIKEKSARLIILNDLKPGLLIEIKSNDIDTFESCRSKMESLIKSLKFE